MCAAHNSCKAITRRPASYSKSPHIDICSPIGQRMRTNREINMKPGTCRTLSVVTLAGAMIAWAIDVYDLVAHGIPSTHTPGTLLACAAFLRVRAIDKERAGEW